MNSTQDSTATQKSLFARYQEHITSAIFIGLVLGILTGLFLASRFDVVLTVTTLLGSIYMNALNMMIFPLVFCSIVVGITSIGNAKTTGKITGGAMIFFLFTTALASFVGLIIPRAINLGKGVRFEMATSDIEASKMTSILDTVKNLIPANPVAAFANGNMLQVLTFAVIIGFTLVAIGGKGEPLLKVIESGNEVCLKIISTVMYFTPHRRFLHHCSGGGSQRHGNHSFPHNPAGRSLCYLLLICRYRVWQFRQVPWQGKPGKVC